MKTYDNFKNNAFLKRVLTRETIKDRVILKKETMKDRMTALFIKGTLPVTIFFKLYFNLLNGIH